MGLEGVADRRLATLSGGMARRADLAASLMHLPRILFLDEPTEGLDPRSRAAVWDSLDELRRQLGMTLVLTTHYMEEADRLCDRIGIIDRGQLITEGTPRDLKSRVGNEALVVKFADEADTQEVARAERALAAVDDARHVQVAGQDVSIFVDDAAAIAPKALRALELAAVTPRSIAITQPTFGGRLPALHRPGVRGPRPARRRGKDRRMSASAQTLLLARRALIQFPRNPILLGFSIMPVLMMYLVFGGLFAGVADLPGFPTDNYFRYLAPTAVLLATVPGIGNAGVALAGDFQSRYFYKLLSAPVSLGVIMYGRLLGDCVRLAVQATLVLVLALALGAHVATGPAGAALMIVMATLLGIVTFGVLSANLAIRTKDAAAVQAVQPMAFLLIFLTSAYQTTDHIDSGVVRTLIEVNPAELVLRPMRDLMLTGYDWGAIGTGFAVIAALGLIGLPLTVRNYRRAYE